MRQINVITIQQIIDIDLEIDLLSQRVLRIAPGKAILFVGA